MTKSTFRQYRVLGKGGFGEVNILLFLLLLCFYLYALARTLVATCSRPITAPARFCFHFHFICTRNHESAAAAAAKSLSTSALSRSTCSRACTHLSLSLSLSLICVYVHACTLAFGDFMSVVSRLSAINRLCCVRLTPTLYRATSERECVSASTILQSVYFRNRAATSGVFNEMKVVREMWRSER